MDVENLTESHKPVEIGYLFDPGRFEKWRGGEGPERTTEAVRGDPSARKGLFHEARRIG